MIPEKKKIKIPRWFWVVASLALLWNIMGVVSYLMEVYMDPVTFSRLPDAQQALIENRPAWATAAFALAVFGGTIGSIMLLLKMKWAREVFIVSLLAVLVQMFHSFFMTNAFDIYGPGAIAMPIMILAIGIGLVWLSNYSGKKRWVK